MVKVKSSASVSDVSVLEDEAAAVNVSASTSVNAEQTCSSNDVTSRPSKSRKRKRNMDTGMWKQNIRKRLRAVRCPVYYCEGTPKPRSVKDTDCSTCRFKCSSNFSSEERLHIHGSFWKLSDSDKRHFLHKRRQ